jgi:replication initiation and membrane attachment protein DnaB
MLQESCPIMAAATPNPTLNDWVKTVLFDRGYLPRIRGEAIKVYLVIIEACGGVPDRSVTISLSLLMQRTQLSCPTVIESLSRLEELGLVVSTTRQRGKVKTYYVSDPPATAEAPPAPAGWSGAKGRYSTKSKDR